MRPLEEELFKDGFAFVARHFPRTSTHDRAILTYLYARRRIGVAVKGRHYRLREPSPPEAEEALTPFRNFVRFVEAKRDGVKYSPDQPRVPEGNPDGGQWTAEGGSGSGDKPANRPMLAWTLPAGTATDAPMPIGQVGFDDNERSMTAEDFIHQKCKAALILRKFPGEALGLTLDKIEDGPPTAMKRTCMKLLTNKRFRK